MTTETKKPLLGVDVECLIPQVTEQVAALLREKALQRVDYTMQAAIDEAVKTYIRENIVPSIVAELAKHEDELRATFAAGVLAAARKIAETLGTKATEKMAGYEGDKILKDMFRALFGGY